MQVGVEPLDGRQVGKIGFVQQALQGAVHEQGRAGFVETDQAGIHVFHNSLEVLELGLFFLPDIAEFVGYDIESAIQLVERLVGLLGGVGGRIVVVFDVEQKRGDLRVGLVHQAEQAEHHADGPKPGQDGGAREAGRVHPIHDPAQHQHDQQDMKQDFCLKQSDHRRRLVDLKTNILKSGEFVFLTIK